MTIQGVLIELTVSNHPGAMSHICGLFSRRAYNLEKILCFPKKNNIESRMWLQVNEQGKLEQVIKQLEKLEDVKHVVCRRNNDDIFIQVEAIITKRD